MGNWFRVWRGGWNHGKVEDHVQILLTLKCVGPLLPFVDFGTLVKGLMRRWSTKNLILLML
jgi:hypothetical protein